MPVVTATPEHEVLYQELAALVSKHKDKVSAIEVLAIAANMVGKLAAMQDQRRYTPEMLMKIIGENIELGNAQVIDGLKGEAKGSA